MIRRPPRSTRTDTLFPYTTLFRSLLHLESCQGVGEAAGALGKINDAVTSHLHRCGTDDCKQNACREAAEVGHFHTGERLAPGPETEVKKQAEPAIDFRSAVHSVGKGCSGRGRSGWWKAHLKKKT